MNGRAFIELWESFIKDPQFLTEGRSWKDAWREEGIWTERVIGKPHGVESSSPLGHALLEKLGQENWRYRKEEWKVDLVLAKKDSNWRVPEAWKGSENEWQGLFWPSTYEILIEHESAGGNSYEEMAKLVLLRARLKVLITYTYDVPSENASKSDDLIEELRLQFRSMITQAHERLPEDPRGEYVLITGRLVGDIPEWHCNVFRAGGAMELEQVFKGDQG